MFKTIILVAFFCVPSIYAQKVEKVITFPLSPYKKLPSRATSAIPLGISTDGSFTKFKVYGIQLIPAKIVAATQKTEEKETKKGLLGGISVFSGKNPNNGGNSSTSATTNPSVPILFEHTLDASLNQVGSPLQGGFYMGRSKLEKNVTYTYEIDDVIKLEEIPRKTSVTYSIDDLKIRDSLFANIGVGQPIGYGIKSEGEGLMGTKNLRTFMYLEERMIMPDVNEFIVERVEKPLAKEKSAEQLKDLILSGGGILRASDDNSFARMFSASYAKDSWDPFKFFHFVVFDKEGNIKAKTPVTFEYIRSVISADIVTDINGKVKGFLYIFGGQVALGQKKQKDPIENRFNLLYFDTQGNLKYKYDFTHGDDGNKQGVNPFLVLEKNGELHALSLNLNESFKPVIETIVFDNSSKKSVGQAISNEEFLKKTGVNLLTVFDGKIETRFENNKIFFLSTDKSLEPIIGDNSTSIKSRGVYQNYNLLWLDENFNVLQTFKHQTEKSYNAPIAENLKFTPELNQYLITQGNNNWILNSTPNKSDLVSINPLSNVRVANPLNQGRNYLIDKSNSKIYFLFRAPGVNEATVALVSY